MKAVNTPKKIGLIVLSGLVFSFGAAAQETEPKKLDGKVDVAVKKDPKSAVKPAEPNEQTPPAVSDVKTEADGAPIKKETPAPDAKVDVKNLSNEEAAVVSYYTSYLTEYRLGPNDVISVEVFGQCPDYCKTGITIRPDAKISYPLIRGGVMVGGKTVEEVQEEITKKLDEYIIDPKVTVTLDKAMSARYSVMGKVATPGIRIMDRKVSLYEAVIESGGVLKTGNKKKIALVRFDAQGKLSRQNVNLADIESGKAPMIYLNPGDQVFVPGKGFTVDSIFQVIDKVSIVRLLFGSPF